MEIQWAAIVLSASYIVLLVAVLYQIAKVRYSSRVCGARVISSFGPCRSSSGGAQGRGGALHTRVLIPRACFEGRVPP